jgi:hypothetical protein
MRSGRLERLLQRFVDSDSGQASVGLVLMLSVFLLAGMGFAVDLANLWFQRQAAQTAADSACVAGAMDMLYQIGECSAGVNTCLAVKNTSGTTLFTIGTSSNCVSSPGAPMCNYASYAGVSGSGFTASTAGSSVSWTFPASVSGVTAPSSTQYTSYPFMTTSIAQNVKTWFMGFVGRKYVQVGASCTCGLTPVLSAPPLVVLHPTISGALTVSGGGDLVIAGGPQRSVTANSSSSTGIACSPSGIIDTSLAGPNSTGGNVGVVGGPSATTVAAASWCWGGGFKPGTTGIWQNPVAPVPDPYAAVPVPAGMKSLTPITGTSGTWVSYHQDGCPDSRTSHYPTTNQCIEFGPGYYPSGITNLDGYSTAIFLPGVYYLNGNLSSGASEYLRNATPCTPTCGSKTSGMTWHQTDGVLFYFLTGSLQLSGCTGCGTSIDNVSSSMLTCNGGAPSSSLSIPTSLSGNVLWGQCTAGGTYWDSAGDTTDSASSSGSRGLLLFMGHGNSSGLSFSGSGSLAFSGSLYLHSTTFGNQVAISGGSSSGTYILGNVIADQVNLSGSGVLKMVLNPSASTDLLKVSIFR